MPQVRSLWCVVVPGPPPSVRGCAGPAPVGAWLRRARPPSVRGFCPRNRGRCVKHRAPTALFAPNTTHRRPRTAHRRPFWAVTPRTDEAVARRGHRTQAKSAHGARQVHFSSPKHPRRVHKWPVCAHGGVGFGTICVPGARRAHFSRLPVRCRRRQNAHRRPRTAHRRPFWAVGPRTDGRVEPLSNISKMTNHCDCLEHKRQMRL